MNDERIRSSVEEVVITANTPSLDFYPRKRGIEREREKERGRGRERKRERGRERES